MLSGLGVALSRGGQTCGLLPAGILVAQVRPGACCCTVLQVRRSLAGFVLRTLLVDVQGHEHPLFELQRKYMPSTYTASS